MMVDARSMVEFRDRLMPKSPCTRQLGRFLLLGMYQGGLFGTI